MTKKNLFISNYSRIEREVVVLSQYVDFSDEQLGIYSPVICDLLLRCGAEIESLYKELYRKEIGNKLPKTVGEMTDRLDKIFCLKDKKLIFSNLNFNFDEFHSIKPFAYKPKTDDDFYTVFCQLKHDRGKNYRRATLKVLLLALGALYILNQLFTDKEIPIENRFFGEDVPDLLSENTDLFVAQVYNYDWDLFDRSFERIKREAKLNDVRIKELKKRFLEKTSLKRNVFLKDECLYRVEMAPRYEGMVQAFGAMTSNDPVMKESVITMLFGDGKDIETLLDKNSIEVFDSVISMAATISHKNRLRICINRKEKDNE